MIARGPTLVTDNDQAMTGSVHIVDLPDASTADYFAYQDPYYQAGIFDEVLILRWRNSLQRSTLQQSNLRQHQLDYLAEKGFSDRLIVCGPLLSNDGTEWRGTALMVELADRTLVGSMMAEGPYAEAGLYERVEIHDWRFGGRPTL